MRRRRAQIIFYKNKLLPDAHASRTGRALQAQVEIAFIAAVILTPPRNRSIATVTIKCILAGPQKLGSERLVLQMRLEGMAIEAAA